MKKGIVLILIAALVLFLVSCGSSAGTQDPKVAADTYLNSGNTFYNKADYDRAIQDYDQAIVLNPNLAEAYNNRGYVYYIKGDINKAVADFEAALKLDSNYTNARKNLARAKESK